MSVINARVGSDKYPVIVSDTAFSDLIDFCSGYNSENIVCIVDDCFRTDSLIDFPQLKKFLSDYPSFFLPGGIESKGIDAYTRAVSWLMSLNFSKDGLIVAIGGGVIGDLSAFVASTFLRGAGLVLVPTTTTSMIDSAIGGKTGINFNDQVNAIGTYFNPKAVFMDVRFLLTLNSRDYCAGLCEAIKMSITSDSYFANKLLDDSRSLSHEVRDPSALLDLVLWSVKTKLLHVSDDPNEKSIRLTLNYGHTFGQSIETFYGLYQDFYRHGEAVSLGMMCAGNAISRINDDTYSNDLLLFTKNILTSFSLPITLRNNSRVKIPSLDVLVDNLINDKKRTSEGNRFVLVPELGTSVIQYIDDKDLLKSSYESIF